MTPRQIKIEDYTYTLPDERIAKYPLEERDASKLAVYKNGNIDEDITKNIANAIPPGTLLVLNETKVVHARLLFRKPTGGAIEVFCLGPSDAYPDIQSAMTQKGKVTWVCLVGGANKWKRDTVINLTNSSPDFILSATILGKEKDNYILNLEWNNQELSFAEVLHFAGKVPLPPYLNRPAGQIDEQRYQTIFAKEEGSVAAPTAALHFTNNVFNSLAQKNIQTAFITLHVGAGTFRPVKSETMAGHDMHEEWFEVSRQSLEQVIKHLDTGIVPVGTTSLRTLESLYWIGLKLLHNIKIDFRGIAVEQWDPYELKADHGVFDALLAIQDYLLQHKQEKLITRTRIMIAPSYDFKVIKGLITNFHQPNSTLLLLVAALVCEDWRKIYTYALNNNFRFLSYGDSSLLWKN